MKNLNLFLNESIIEEGIIDKCKAIAKAAHNKILRKINNLENPLIMVDLGVNDIYNTWHYWEAETLEFAVADIKVVIDKLNKYILDNVKSAKKLRPDLDEDAHLYELVGYTSDDAIKLYNTVSDMFVKEMKKIGINEIKDNSDIWGSGLKSFNHLETAAEFKLERTLDSENDDRLESVYVFPSVRLEYI